MSSDTIVLHEIDKCSCKIKRMSAKSAKTVGKDSPWEIVSIDRRTTIYGLEAGEIIFFLNAYHAVHSNAFADLPVSSSLYHLYSSRAGLHTSVISMIQCKSPVTRWHNNLSLAGK